MLTPIVIKFIQGSHNFYRQINYTFQQMKEEMVGMEPVKQDREQYVIPKGALQAHQIAFSEEFND